MSRSTSRATPAATKEALARRAHQKFEIQLEAASSKLSRADEGIAEVDEELVQLGISPGLQRQQRILQDSLYKQLKSKLVSFLRALKKQLQDKSAPDGPAAYRRTLYLQLRRLLNQLLMQENFDIQRAHLERIYLWFFQRLRAEPAPTTLKPILARTSDIRPDKTLSFAGSTIFGDSPMRSPNPFANSFTKDRLPEVKPNFPGATPLEEVSTQPGTMDSHMSAITSLQKSALAGRSNFRRDQQPRGAGGAPTEGMHHKNRLEAAAIAAQGLGINYRDAYMETSTSDQEGEEGSSYDGDEDSYETDEEEEGEGGARAVGGDGQEEGEEEQESEAAMHREAEQLAIIKNFKTEPVAKVFDLTMDPAKLPAEKKKDEDDMEPPDPDEDKLTTEKAKKRLLYLKKFQGHTIRPGPNKPEDLSNIFITSRGARPPPPATAKKEKRPGTADTSPSPGASPSPSPEKEEEAKKKKKKKKGEEDDQDQEKEHEKIQLQNVKGLNLGLRTEFDDYLAMQRDEIERLKGKLAKDLVFCGMKTLERAILMPVDLPPQALVERGFPWAGARLMGNPFAEKKKKKKKKKKKGKSKKKKD